ncbi:DNA/RNA polymerase [Jaminaea rosea]|uniref:DNA-directed RNA polymerase n=1 Tax=Jaminaea rosea TaxID=1569628 RepID=A0A316ULQ1_9BASI|nr:DNA/RNA polymerase [Jaminaea rosea]PWN26187.1 DNA/RNA polymerase [Jaminaea rosea]
MAFAWRLAAIRRQAAAVTASGIKPPSVRHAAAALHSSAKWGASNTHPRHQHTDTASASSSSHNDGVDSSSSLNSFAWRNRKSLRLPTPLPMDVTDAANSAFRNPTSGSRSGRPRRQAASSANAALNPIDLLSFGDISGATLDDINRDSSYYPPSQPVENLAILEACLSANLLSRAMRIFEDMRDNAAARLSRQDIESVPKGSAPSNQLRKRWSAQHSLSRRVYASVFAAILRRAAAERDEMASQKWIQRAWSLYREMETGVRSDAHERKAASSRNHSFTADPRPDERTFMTFAMGLVKVMLVHPTMTMSESGLGDLVASAWRSGLSFDDIVEQAYAYSTQAEDSMRSSEHVEPQVFIQRLISAAVHAGNDPVKTTLENLEKKLVSERLAEQQHEQQPEAQEAESSSSGSGSSPRTYIPPLKPVLSGRADAPEGATPFNLDLLRRDLGIVGQGRATARDNEERQRWLEESAIDSARQHLEALSKQLASIGVQSTMTLTQDRQLQLWMWDWNQKLQVALERDVHRILSKAEESSTKGTPAGQRLFSTGVDSRENFEQSIAPFLGTIPSSKLSLLTIMELMRLQATAGAVDGIKTASTLIAIGRAVEEEHYAHFLRSRPDLSERVRRAHELVRNKSTTDLAARRKAKKWLESQDDGRMQWTQNVRARVGSYLVGHLLQLATVKREAIDRDGHVWSEEHPAMVSTYQYVQGKKIGVLKLNDHVAQRLDKESVRGAMHARYLPMLVKPRLWLKPDEGGYLTTKTNMMRYKESAEQVSYLKAASADGNRLETVMCALDALGETPWIINSKVLEVMTEVWNSGKDTADMPPLISDDWNRRERPADFDTNLIARNEYLQHEKQNRQLRASAHSRRCDVNYKLEIARSFVDEVIYFPHNVDFRGRAYPVPPHLNHMGDDLCRGLLLFAEAKPLGVAGLKWLRIHLANVYGYDKASFDERVQFSVDHFKDIEAAVKDPLGPNKWWLGADDPWQCLATCHELYAAINHPEGPEKFPSRIPVHQDGTCNGLQHYAALGGDIRGAKQVNLTSGERPADVYTAVADLVIKEIEEEARRDDPDPAAVELLGKVTRKVVKQTVMTTVYGVTFIGAKNQVQKQLADRGDVDPMKIFHVSTYLAKKILACIGNLFAGANRIQHWFVDVARLISRSIPPERMPALLESSRAAGRLTDPKTGLKTGNTQRFGPGTGERVNMDRVPLEQMTSVIWTSPIGMPIVQPYRKHKKTQIATALQTLFLRDPNANAEVSPAKQASAFPPNFIHSLDATHMLLSALECQDAGLTFAAVHDSYWTHACDVETMSDIIRDTFVRLHTQDILPKLREEFLERYRGHMVPVTVAQYLISRRLARRSKESLQAIKAAELSGVELSKEEKDVLLANVESEVVDIDALSAEERKELFGTMPTKAKELANGRDVEPDTAVDAESDQEAADLEAMAADEGLDADVVDEEESKKSKGTSVTGRGKGGGRGRVGDYKMLPPELRADAVTRFVPLEALIPPLPAKGGFDVNEIRKSKYFFS